MPSLSQAADAATDRDSVRILSYEPFRPLTPPSSSVSRKANTGTLTRLQFDAFGRRFEVALEKNTRLTRSIDLSNPNGPALSLYQGTLDNIPGSWVRMSAQGPAVRGMIWDGRELYIVELADALGDALPTQQKSGDTGTIVFRLADTEVEPGASFCGQDQSTATRNGKTAYAELLNELKGSPAIMRAPGAAMRLEISALGDTLFHQRFVTDQKARDEILVRLNNVDGIFSSQLGVEIQVPTLQIKNSSTDPLTGTTVPGDLLRELGSLRRQTPELRARGLTHLFTGRDLDGTTVGIAYTDALCSDQYGAGLTQVSGRSSWIESLITAHEIGHNFGAVHDGEGQCASTPQNQYIMSPGVAPTAQTFSQCSLDAMRPRVQSATCITGLTPADVSIPAELGTWHKAVTRPFDWELTVSNVGGSSATGVRATVLVPPVVQVDQAWVDGSSCTAGAGLISCDLGDIAAAGSRVVHLVLRSDAVGSSSISARIAADSDSRSTNNSGDGTLIIDPEADLALAAQSPDTVAAGTSATVSFTATNLAVIDARSVNVDFALSGGISAAAAQIDNGSCTVQAASVRCSVSSVAASSAVNGTVTLNATTAGTATVQATISGGYVDPDNANDAATRTINVTAQPANQSSGGQRGGGGGSTGALLLVAMAALLAARSFVRAGARVRAP